MTSSLSGVVLPSTPIIYPEGDGKPMADNTRQFRWITTIVGGLQAVFDDDPNVFVAGDLFWYPVEGNNSVVVAPDVLVVFGRPKGERGSYKQWEEDDIPPQVVFEIVSPSNNEPEIQRKLAFYQQYGVQEFYVYDPDRVRLRGWIRAQASADNPTAGRLVPIPEMEGWVSPLLKVRFQLDRAATDYELVMIGPDGRPFASFVEVIQQREQAEEQARRLEKSYSRERRRRKQNRTQYLRERDQRMRAERLIEQAESLAKTERDQRVSAESLAKAERDQRVSAESLAKAERDQREQAENESRIEQERREQAEARLKRLLEQMRAAGLQPEET